MRTPPLPALITGLAFVASLFGCGGASDVHRTQAKGKVTPEPPRPTLDRPTLAAPGPAWRAVEPENLILIEVVTGTIAIELAPEAAPETAAQFRKLVRAGFYDQESFYRVVQGHVAQAGREFDHEIRSVPTLPFEAERVVSREGFAAHGNPDLFAAEVGHRNGFAVGRGDGREWLLNCQGTVGMARDDAPDSGSSEFFIPLLPRRYLDRNYAVFGRVIDGMDNVDRLARVDPLTEEETMLLRGADVGRAATVRQARSARLAPNAIRRARVASDIPEPDRPRYQVMATPSAEWEALKTSKRDYSQNPAFVSPPPRVLEVCALPVPARRLD